MRYLDNKHPRSELICYSLILYLNLIHVRYIIYMRANILESVSIIFREVHVKFITYDTTQLFKPH